MGIVFQALAKGPRLSLKCLELCNLLIHLGQLGGNHLQEPLAEVAARLCRRRRHYLLQPSRCDVVDMAGHGDTRREEG